MVVLASAERTNARCLPLVPCSFFSFSFRKRVGHYEVDGTTGEELPSCVMRKRTDDKRSEDDMMRSGEQLQQEIMSNHNDTSLRNLHESSRGHLRPMIVMFISHHISCPWGTLPPFYTAMFRMVCRSPSRIVLDTILCAVVTSRPDGR